MSRHKSLSLHHLTEAQFPVLRLDYQDRLDLTQNYQADYAHLDVEDFEELLRQQSYAIKNQLVASKTAY